MSTFSGREMFTAISFPGMRATVRTHRGALTGRPPVSTMRLETGSQVSAPSLHFPHRTRRHEFLDEHVHLLT
jgi:hypothetical protein